MKLALESTAYEEDIECCDDFDWSKIKDESHLEFLRWSHFLEGRVSILEQNIFYFQEFMSLYNNEKAKANYNTFVVVSIHNYSSLIAIGFDNLYSDTSQLNISAYIGYCKQHRATIFGNKDVLSNLKEITKKNNIIKNKCRKFIFDARKKIFAHNDKELINNELYIDKILSLCSYLEFEKMIKDIKEVLDSIWYNYRCKKMKFGFDNNEDFYKIIDFIKQ